MANGEITYTNPGGESSNKAFASGSYTGSGAAINILVGFVPSKIVIHNDTDNTEFVWFAGIAEGSMFQYTSAGAKTLITGGPTLYGDTADDVWNGSGGDSNANGHGFTVPATAVLNTAADDCYWEAYR